MPAPSAMMAKIDRQGNGAGTHWAPQSFLSRATSRSVCGPHAQSAEHDPGDEPEEIEGEAENHWINAVPERYRKAHRNEGNQAEQESADRWFFHMHESMIVTRRSKAARRRSHGQRRSTP